MGGLSQPKRAEAAELVKDFCRALDREIEAERNEGGKPYLITDGRLLCEHRGRADYLFLLEVEVTVPDGSPVRVEVNRLRVEGFLISKDGNEVLLELDADLGNEVPQAQMYCEPWRLLQGLQQRLREMASGDWGNLDLAVAALKGGSIPCVEATTAGTGEVSVRSDGGGRVAGLNESELYEAQKAALERAMREAVLYVWGPPGTGKTQVLGLLAASFLRRGRRVLILSHSNVAVDGAVYRTLRCLGESEGRGGVIRYGWARLPEVRSHPFLLASRLAEDLRPDIARKLRQLQEQRRKLREQCETDRSAGLRLRTVDQEIKALREQLREAELRVAQNARVLGTTLSKAVVDPVVFRQEFDTVMVDEVSMAYIPQVFFAAGVARGSVVLFGDFRQLAPIALSDDPLVERWLHTDVFEYAGIRQAVDERGMHPRLVMLDVQRRMHPAISAFPSIHVYGFKLHDAPDIDKERDGIVNGQPFPGAPVVLLDVSGLKCFCHEEASSQGARTQSRHNSMTALLSAWVAGLAVESGRRSVGLIAPYASHSRLLLALLRDLYPRLLTASADSEAPYAATVHRFQGSERDVIVFDYVDAYPMKKPGAPLCCQRLDQTRRLLNVAITRARGKLVVVADTAYVLGRVGRESVHNKFLNYLKEKALTLRSEELVCLLPRSRVGQHGSLAWHDPHEGQARLLEDLTRAQSSVRLCVPYSTLRGRHRVAPPVLRALIDASRRGVRVVVEGKPEDWVRRDISCAGFEPVFVPNDYTWTPVLAIDDRVFWCAAPILHEALGEYPLVFRLDGQRSTRQFSSLLFRDQGGHGVSSLEPERKGLARFVEENSLPCPCCGRPMRLVTSRQGRRFLGCSGYPSCSHAAPLDRELLEVYVSKEKVKCPLCGAAAAVRYSRTTGTFIGCSRYPLCNGIIRVQDL